MRIRRAAVARRAYVQVGTPQGTLPGMPKDMKQHPRIAYTESRGLTLRDVGTPEGSSASVRVEGPLQTNASDTVRASVLVGVGIADSSTCLFQDLVASGEVQELL